MNLQQETESDNSSCVLRVRHVMPLNRNLNTIKRSYVTRRIKLDAGATLITGAKPKPGDLVLARVSRLGQHRRLESPEGRRQHLFVGDEILLCYGARYASDQFESYVPDDLGPCQMVAAGGIASLARAKHKSVSSATDIEPIGLIGNDGGSTLNLAAFSRKDPINSGARTTNVAVVGTSMNAGKTTTGASIVRGLKADGHVVGVAKVTGTGSGGDRWHYQDVGASVVLDFSDFGYASTYGVPRREMCELFDKLMFALRAENVTAVVVEIADGLYFSETAELVTSRTFANHVDDIVLAAGDAMGASAGVEWLKRADLPLCAVAGRLTSSPLAVIEARRILEVPIVTREELLSEDWYRNLHDGGFRQSKIA